MTQKSTVQSLLFERSQSGIDRRGSLQVGDLHNAILIGEGTVDGLNRQVEVLLLDTDNDVDLVTALRDHAHTHAGLAKHTKQMARDTCAAAQVTADGSDERQALDNLDLERLDLLLNVAHE